MKGDIGLALRHGEFPVLFAGSLCWTPNLDFTLRVFSADFTNVTKKIASQLGTNLLQSVEAVFWASSISIFQ
jgi:hypothetical protein